MFGRIVKLKNKTGSAAAGAGYSVNEPGLKKEIGIRFRLFRQAIGKKQIQLARELRVSQSVISFIEMGSTFPKIDYIHYLYGYYRLNIDWLLGGAEPMFLPVKGEGIESNSFLPCHIPYQDPVYDKYVELMESMQVPVVEKTILEEAARIKRYFKDRQKV